MTIEHLADSDLVIIERLLLAEDYRLCMRLTDVPPEERESLRAEIREVKTSLDSLSRAMRARGMTVT